MPASKHVTAYPPEMLQACLTAQAKGRLFIPFSRPAALRFKFYGLFGALRHAGRSEAEALSISLSDDPQGIWLIHTPQDDIGRAVKAALPHSDDSPESDPFAEAERLLERLSAIATSK